MGYKKLIDPKEFIAKDVGKRFDIAPDPQQKKAGKVAPGTGQGGQGN